MQLMREITNWVLQIWITVLEWMMLCDYIGNVYFKFRYLRLDLVLKSMQANIGNCVLTNLLNRDLAIVIKLCFKDAIGNRI